MIKYRFLFFILFAFTLSVVGQTREQTEDLRTIVTLLDYVSKDYKEAVEDGEIIDDAEFEEQLDFTERSAGLHKELLAVFTDDVFAAQGPRITELRTAISELAPVEIVAKLSLSIKNTILDLGYLKISPVKWPSINNGRELYAINCASCHGIEGHGDGEAGEGLDPEPTSFQDEDAMSVLSALQAYNVIKLGVDGTGMASYDEVFSEYQLWDLAFYVMSIRHEKLEEIKELPSTVLLDSISKWTDNQLEEFVAQYADLSIAQIRGYEPVRPEPLDVSLSELDQSYEVYKTGDRKQAGRHALTSYLEGIELVESILNATNPEVVNVLEKDMVLYRRAIQAGNDAEVERLYTKLRNEIESAKELLNEVDYSFAFIYGASLSILIREALEALLIILIMLSILRPLGIKKAITAVHLGWMSAVAIGFVGWFFVDYLVGISGASRELMEGIGSIIAVLVLIYAGTWLHSHAKVSTWTNFVKTKINTIKETGNWFGLALFSFIVVFREAVEVVLFLSSLKLNNPETASSAISWALVTTIVVIAIFAYIFLKTTKRLPITQIFKISAYAIAVLAVILTGRGVMALQEAGYLPVTPVEFLPKIDLLGVYPNVQSFVAQLIVLVLIIWLSKRSSKKED